MLEANCGGVCMSYWNDLVGSSPFYPMLALLPDTRNFFLSQIIFILKGEFLMHRDSVSFIVSNLTA